MERQANAERRHKLAEVSKLQPTLTSTSTFILASLRKPTDAPSVADHLFPYHTPHPHEAPNTATMPEVVDPRMMSVQPRIRYNTIGGINGPLVVLDNVRGVNG